jgi:hypothetical protein
MRETFEAAVGSLDIYDDEHGVLNARIRKSWPHEGKHKIVGSALDGRRKAARQVFFPVYSL